MEDDRHIHEVLRRLLTGLYFWRMAVFGARNTHVRSYSPTIEESKGRAR